MATKFKITPLIIVAAGLICFAIYSMFFGGNLGPLVGIVLIAAGMLCLAPYYILKWIFPGKIWRQVAVEMLLVIIAAFFIYRINGKMVVEAPPGYKGYVYVVYGVEGKPPIPPVGIFGHHTYLPVSQNGIFITSTQHPNGFMNKLAFDDNSKLLIPGYGVGNALDTVKCGAKSYLAEVLIIGKMPANWQYAKDTLKRDSIKALISKLIIH